MPVKKKEETMIKYFVEYGTNINAKNGDNYTLYMIISTICYYDIDKSNANQYENILFDWAQSI